MDTREPEPHFLMKLTNAVAETNKPLLDLSKTKVNINCPKLVNNFLSFKAILKEARTFAFLKTLAIGNKAERR